MTLPRNALPLVCTLAALSLAGCSQPLDLDLRGDIGGGLDTSQAAQTATGARPDPDDRGVISYPGYQVAVARRGDTLADVAQRVGLPAAEVARYNGVAVDDPLRRGEIIALPRRVAEPSPATGADTTGPIRPPSQVDVATLAGNAIDRAPDTSRAAPDAQTGIEPVRHKVKRGETAFTIARLYDVSPRSLAEWNALDRDFSVREGQFLLVPVVQQRDDTPDPTPPGNGSPTPTPPSAAQPLPQDESEPAAPPSTPAAARSEPAAPAPQAPAPEPEPETPVADIGQDDAPSSNASFRMPVQGSVIRAYAKGRNDGIDIGAPAGTAVRAAASGSVAHVGASTDGTEFAIIRHPDGLLTVYKNIDPSIERGDAVSRGQQIGAVPEGRNFVGFEVRRGMDSVDPMQYLQ